MNKWIENARRIADDVLAPSAADVDLSGTIPARNFERLAEDGFYGITAATDIDLPTIAEVAETLFAACLATGFVWAQHHGVARRVAASPNTELRDRYSGDLQTGRVRAGVTYAGAADKPTLFAHRDGDGYRISGTAPFVTGWGIVDIIGVIARDAADPAKLISVIVPATESPSMAAHRLPLIAADAGRTVSLVFDDLAVDSSAIDTRLTIARFEAARVFASWLNGSLSLGIVRRSIGELSGESAAALALQHSQIRADLDASLSGTPDIYEVRARASALALHAAGSLVTALGSSAVLRGSVAERSVREATFTLVFASRPPIKSALMTLLTGGPAASVS